MIDMIKSIVQWLDGVKRLVATVAKQEPIYVTSYRVPGSFAILYIYYIAGISPHYRLAIDSNDSSGIDQKYIDKLFTNQNPLEEIATGIHDKAISKFIGSPFDGKQVAR